MQVRQLDRHVFDVFLGTGFNQWSRVRRFHWGYKVVNGNFLPKEILKEVSSTINQNPHGSLENI